MSIVNTIAIKRALSAVDLQNSEGCFVKKDANGKLILVNALADYPLGCVHVGGNVGENTDYFLGAYQGIVRVKLDSTATGVVEGTQLAITATGTVKTGVATNIIVARACEAGTAGDLIEAYLISPFKLA